MSDTFVYIVEHSRIFRFEYCVHVGTILQKKIVAYRFFFSETTFQLSKQKRTQRWKYYFPFSKLIRRLIYLFISTISEANLVSVPVLISQIRDKKYYLLTSVSTCISWNVSTANEAVIHTIACFSYKYVELPSNWIDSRQSRKLTAKRKKITRKVMRTY